MLWLSVRIDGVWDDDVDCGAVGRVFDVVVVGVRVRGGYV